MKNTPFPRWLYPPLLCLSSLALAQSTPAVSGFVVRSPAQYLKDFKQLIASDDISDYKAVGQALQMPVEPKVGESVDSSNARGNSPIAGISRDFRRTGPAPEYLDYPFLYGDFVPKNRGAARVLMNVYLDKTHLCVTKSDLDATFGSMRSVKLTGDAGVAYSTDVHGQNDLTATFIILSDTPCAERVDLMQNTQRD